jgi:hypothetical protein
MRPYDYIILEDLVSADIASMSVVTQHFTFVSYQLLVLDGNLTGTITLQVSNDNVNWVDATNTIESFSGVTNGIVEVSDVCVGFVRVFISYTSGSSNVVVKMNNKGIT